MTSAISGMSARVGMTTTPMVRGVQPPNFANMADEAFSKLDTGKKGYLNKSDLQSAIDKANGGQSANSNASAGPSVDDLLQSLDASGDGKVTKQEFSDGIQKLADQSSQAPGMKGSSPPSGLQGPSPGAGGKPKGSSSSNSSSAVYDPADTNKDGIVSEAELIAYQSTSAYINSHPTDDTSNDPSLEGVQKAKQLLQAYIQNPGSTNEDQNNFSIKI